MAPVFVTFSTAGAIKDMALVTRLERDRVRQAVRRTRRSLAVDVKQQGDAQIRAAGNFGSDWTDAFIVTQRGERTDTQVLEFSFGGDRPYGAIFETGGTIHGKPLLWIPLPWTGLKDVWARNYPGRLFRVNNASRSGNPLLFDVSDKQAKYVGVRSVFLKPRFGLVDMINRIVPPKLAESFARIWGREGGTGA